VGLLLAEDRDQHVGDGHFLLAARLDVKDRALQDPLESERRLDLAVVVGSECRRGFVDEFLQVRLQPRQIRAAGLQDLAHPRGIQDRQQQVLDRHVLVTGIARLLEGLVQAVLEFTR